MKNLFLIASLSLFSVVVCTAQNQIIEDFYGKYQSYHNDQRAEDDIKEVIENLEKKEQKKSTISSYRIIQQNGDNSIPAEAIKKLIKDLQQDNFEELVAVNDETTTAYLLAKEDANRSITDLFFLKREDHEFLFFNLSGNINFGELINSGYKFSLN